MRLHDSFTDRQNSDLVLPNKLVQIYLVGLYDFRWHVYGHDLTQVSLEQHLNLKMKNFWRDLIMNKQNIMRYLMHKNMECRVDMYSFEMLKIILYGEKHHFDNVWSTLSVLLFQDRTGDRDIEWQNCY